MVCGIRRWGGCLGAGCAEEGVGGMTGRGSWSVHIGRARARRGRSLHHWEDAARHTARGAKCVCKL